MLSERIKVLYSVLQCGNTDIARHAGCTPGNISRLHSGKRVPASDSRTIGLFVQGVYAYADYENMLPVLMELCGASDPQREELLPALVAWLYGTKDVTLPSRTVTPKSKRMQKKLRSEFGEKLDRAMTLLEISNAQMAVLLNVDQSLVSRYRSGQYTPYGNRQLCERLCWILAERAVKKGREGEIADLCKAGGRKVDPEMLEAWLFDNSAEEDTTMAVRYLLRSLDVLSPMENDPAKGPEEPESPAPPACSHYLGVEGLRQAVLRFLSDAARIGGELLLYSDEPMEWMTGDKAFFALWSSHMMRCVQKGVRIRIIHHVDRPGTEMVDGIMGWVPLYVTGMIEPYIFRRERNPRFYHTVFLHSGHACIRGFFPTGASEERWYEYITDERHLGVLQKEYVGMLQASSPFLKTYTAAMGDAYHRVRLNRRGNCSFLLSGFPVFTMPEKVFRGILERTVLEETKRDQLLERYRSLRAWFTGTLQQNSIEMILFMAEPEAGEARAVNWSFDLAELSAEYNEEEFASHMAEIRGLVLHERNFHLTILPKAPFRDIQMVVSEETATVLRRQAPYAAFVFRNPALTAAASEYLSGLADSHVRDRNILAEMLTDYDCKENGG